MDNSSTTIIFVFVVFVAIAIIGFIKATDPMIDHCQVAEEYSALQVECHKRDLVWENFTLLEAQGLGKKRQHVRRLAQHLSDSLNVRIDSLHTEYLNRTMIESVHYKGYFDIIDHFGE